MIYYLMHKDLKVLKMDINIDGHINRVIEVYGGTTWIQHSGYTLRGATTGVVANNTNKTAGNDTVTLSQSNLPAHVHLIDMSDSGAEVSGYGLTASVQFQNGVKVHQYSDSKKDMTGPTGSGTAVNITNPYKSVYIWERTA